MKLLTVLVAFLLATRAFATVVQPLGAASSVLIPAAGSTGGVNGTFFRSDISIVNFASHTQSVLLEWLPQPGAGPGVVGLIAIPALSGIRSADFVHDTFNRSGLGAIIISGVSAAGQSDPSALLYVSARIWTPQPGTSGTTSQSFFAIPVSTINTPGAAALFALGGPEQLGDFRVNVGIVNLDPDRAQTFAIQIPSAGVPPAPLIREIPPMSMLQVPIGAGGSTLGPVTQVSIDNITAAATKSNRWTAYGSVVDNVTGDAWSELAVAGTAP